LDKGAKIEEAAIAYQIEEAAIDCLKTLEHQIVWLIVVVCSLKATPSNANQNQCHPLEMLVKGAKAPKGKFAPHEA
jgi:hypothetical protein